MGDRVLLVLISVSTTIFAINVVLSAVAGATEGVFFKHRTGDVSKRHNTLITPIGWAFMIWNVIFLVVGASMTYLTVNLCRSNVNGLGKLYCNPAVFSRSVAVAFILNQIFYVTWLFVWDNEQMTSAAAILGCIMLTNWVTLAIFCRNLQRVTDYLSLNAPVDLATYRILVQNAFGMYTAWTTLACILNANVAAIYDGEESNQQSSMICLAVLTSIIILWCMLAFTVLDRFVRYMLTPLLTILWGLSGTMAKLRNLPDDLEDDSEPVVSFVIGLLVLIVALIILQFSLVIYRHRRKPLYIASPQ